jgi:hypothetical protein
VISIKLRRFVFFLTVSVTQAREYTNVRSVNGNCKQRRIG